MQITLNEDLWNVLNPAFDGHYGLTGEFGENYSPVWKPLKDVTITPIMTCKLMEVGKLERKTFVVEKEGLPPQVIGETKIEITEDSIYVFHEDKKQLLASTKVIPIKEV